MLKHKIKGGLKKNLSETFLVGAPCNLISLCIFQLIHINFFILINPFPLPLPLQSSLGFFKSHLEASESFLFSKIFEKIWKNPQYFWFPRFFFIKFLNNLKWCYSLLKPAVIHYSAQAEWLGQNDKINPEQREKAFNS